MALILIVEDEVFVLRNAEGLMEDLGHKTLAASDLDEAIEHLSAPAVINALFVDMRLQDAALGGYEVANRAIVLHPDVRVLYTSGTQLTSEMSDGFVPGGHFLQKPYSQQQLETSVERLLR